MRSVIKEPVALCMCGLIRSQITRCLKRCIARKNTLGVSGFALVEVAISLVVIGLVTAGLMHMMTQMKKIERQKNIKRKQDVIFSALGAFVQEHGCLPCPSDPKDGRGKARRSCQSPQKIFGHVPFQTLGISNNDTQVFGGEIVYVVNPFLCSKKMSAGSARKAYCSHSVKPVIKMSGRTEGTENDPIASVLLVPVKPRMRLSTLFDSIGFFDGEGTLLIQQDPRVFLSYFETKKSLASRDGRLFCFEENKI